MFETNKGSEFMVPPLLARDGYRIWGDTGHRIHVPWFHVTVCQTDELGRHMRLRFISQIPQLINLAADDNGPAQMVSVRLVSPADLNGTGDWQMEPLREIWQGTEPDYDQLSTVYVLADNRRYVDSDTRTPESQLKGLNCIFSFQPAVQKMSPATF